MPFFGMSKVPDGQNPPANRDQIEENMVHAEPLRHQKTNKKEKSTDNEASRRKNPPMSLRDASATLLEGTRAGITPDALAGLVSGWIGENKLHAVSAAGLAEVLANYPEGRPLSELLRKPTGTLQAEPVSRDTVLRSLGGGTPLESSVRNRMESALSTTLGHVRVHTDDQAHKTATSLSARAFTVGEHVGFAKGAYQPGTARGDATLAHELVHVAQNQKAQATPGITPHGHAAERMADQAAQHVASGRIITDLSPFLVTPAVVSLTRDEISRTDSTGSRVTISNYQLTQSGNACGTTSTAMVLQFLGYSLRQADVDSMIRSNPDFVDMFTSPNSIIGLFSRFGVQSTGFQNNQFSHIRQNVDSRVPMVAVIDADGSSGQSTAGVHYVVIDGYDDAEGAEQIHIVNPWGASSTLWEPFGTWAPAHWENLQFPWPFQLMNRFYIAVGPGGVGGSSMWAGMAPGALVAEGAANFMEALGIYARTRGSWDEVLNSLTHGTMQLVLSIAETVSGGVAFLAQNIGRWMTLVSDLGVRLIERGGAGNIAGGIFLTLVGAPFWIAGRIIDVVANIAGAIGEVITAPFRALIDWMSEDDRIRAIVRQRVENARNGRSGTLAELNEQTVQSMLRELMEGYCGDDDEDAILQLLEATTQPGAQAMMSNVLRDSSLRQRLYRAVDGAQYHRLVRLMATHLGNDVRTEIFEELLVGWTSGGDEDSLISIISSIPVPDAETILTPQRRRRIYDDVDGANFTRLMGVMFDRFPNWRGEIIDRICASNCGDAREQLIIRKLRNLSVPEFDGLMQSGSRRQALFSAIDGAEYQEFCRLVGIKASNLEVKADVIRDLMRGSCGDDDEDSILAILRGIDEPVRSNLVRSVGRSNLDSAIDGQQQDELDALLGAA